MKSFLLVALICLNLVLIGVLAFGVSAPRAEAQTRFGTPNYTMITGQYSSNEEAVYVVDVRNRRLGAWVWDKSTKRLLPQMGRELERDLRSGR